MLGESTIVIGVGCAMEATGSLVALCLWIASTIAGDEEGCASIVEDGGNVDIRYQGWLSTVDDIVMEMVFVLDTGIGSRRV